MTDFTFECPLCGQKIEAIDECVGQTHECPACQRQITLPEPLGECKNTERCATNKVEDDTTVRVFFCLGIFLVIWLFAFLLIKSPLTAGPSYEEVRQYPGHFAKDHPLLRPNPLPPLMSTGRAFLLDLAKAFATPLMCSVLPLIIAIVLAIRGRSFWLSFCRGLLSLGLLCLMSSTYGSYALRRDLNAYKETHDSLDEKIRDSFLEYPLPEFPPFPGEMDRELKETKKEH